MAQTDERVKFKRGKSSTIPTAKEAGTLLIETDTGNAYVDDTDTNRVQLTDTRKLSLSGGTMTGDIDMGDNNITTSHTPKNGEDVVNKDYVDNSIPKYSAEDPISIEDNTIKHKEFTKQSGGPDSRQTLTYGGTFIVPSIESDSHGHVTAIADRTMTMPEVAASTDYATNAGHADNADNATNAENATNATNAENATKLATARTLDGVSFDGTSNIVHYGTCSTEAGTAEKITSVSNFVLATGAEVEVKFDNTNTAVSITLNVSDTGAKYIYYNGATLNSNTADYIKAGHVYRFVYDGTNYVLVGDINTDTISAGYTAESPIVITSDNVIEHDKYGEQSGGPTQNEDLDYESTFVVPQILSDEYGHVTDIVNRSMKLPASEAGNIPVYTASYPITITDDYDIEHEPVEDGAVEVGPDDDEDLELGDSFDVPYISTDQWGHVTAGINRKLTLPDAIENAETAERLEESFNVDGISTDGTVDVLHYGICDTDGATQEKIVDCDGFEGTEGAVIRVKFSNSNTAESPTMNVNDVGKMLITHDGISFTDLQANRVYEFVIVDEKYELVTSISESSDGALEMILSNTAYAFITDEYGNVIMDSDTGEGIVGYWNICNCEEVKNELSEKITEISDVITDEEIDALFD